MQPACLLVPPFVPLLVPSPHLVPFTELLPLGLGLGLHVLVWLTSLPSLPFLPIFDFFPFTYLSRVWVCATALVACSLFLLPCLPRLPLFCLCPHSFPSLHMPPTLYCFISFTLYISCSRMHTAVYPYFYCHTHIHMCKPCIPCPLPATLPACLYARFTGCASYHTILPLPYASSPACCACPTHFHV